LKQQNLSTESLTLVFPIPFQITSQKPIKHLTAQRRLQLALCRTNLLQRSIKCQCGTIFPQKFCHAYVLIIFYVCVATKINLNLYLNWYELFVFFFMFHHQVSVLYVSSSSLKRVVDTNSKQFFDFICCFFLFNL